MLKKIIRLIFKISIQYVIWVFILSFSWSGKTLFERSRPYIFENKIVQVIKKNSVELWNVVYDSFPNGLKNLFHNKSKNKT